MGLLRLRIMHLFSIQLVGKSVIVGHCRQMACSVIGPHVQRELVKCFVKAASNAANPAVRRAGEVYQRPWCLLQGFFCGNLLW